MEKIDDNYNVELNFVDELSLSRHGMIKEIETEFNVIRLCIQEISELDKKYVPMLDRISVMPLRKLLCEDNSVLLKVCPSFRMPPLVGFDSMISENQRVIRPPFSVKPVNTWITIQEWRDQEISRFMRTADDIATMLPEFSYDSILNRLNGKKYRTYKSTFESLYDYKQVEFKGEVLSVYCKKNPSDKASNQILYNILEQIGYNKLSVYEFIKHMSDKRGAHIDVGHSLVVEMVNSADKIGLTPIYYLAIHMIYAAKKQIPELEDYWEDMPDLMI